ncbi:MAG: DUF3368 domain-containing protein [Thermoanaerobaculia bacterium]|nr:DUF3368 domain-containing protein [Thermoanaerobaculia bacterium]
MREGLEIVGTLGILLEAKRLGIIPLVTPLLYAFLKFRYLYP